MQPLQGLWTAEMYLRLTDTSNQLLEFTDGLLEGLPMPTRRHQRMVVWLLDVVRSGVRPHGEVMIAPLRLQVRADTFREPDVLVLRDRNDPRNQERFWLGADLVVEVVSPDNPARDIVVKRADYAAAGIPEYWIVDPQHETVTVLTLRDDQYHEHGVFRRGTTATSVLLASLTASVDALFDAQ